MKKLLLGAGLSIVLLGAGCSGSSTPSGAGGVYGTADGGRTWAAMNTLPLATGVSTISGADILSLTQDPSNPKVIYAGTRANGLIMSVDGAKTWQRPPEDKAFELVKTGTVLDVEIDSKKPCTWYILKADRLIKTDTCGRTYNVNAYQEGNASKQLTAMALDWYDPSILWLGTTNGDVMRSTDGGNTWSTPVRLRDDISAIEVSRADSRVVLVGTKSKSMVHTNDSGATWVEHDKDFSKLAKSYYIHGYAQTADGKMIYMSTDYGIFSSIDNGTTWTPLTLITAKGEVKITAIGVARKNPNVLVYGTSSTFYRSTNGGQAWTTTDLPTTRMPSAILFTGESEVDMLLGVLAPAK